MTKPAIYPSEASTLTPSRATTTRATTTNKNKPAPKMVRQSTVNKKEGLASTAGPIQTIDKRKRIAANARERKRMHLLNKAYDKLRKRLADAENKSKYDVLVQAKEYIQALTSICENFDKKHPNEYPRMEPVRDTWQEDESSTSEQSQRQRSVSSVPDATGAPNSPFSPAVTVKRELEFSPQASSVMSPSSDSCFSPMSQPDSVVSPCSQQTQVITHTNGVLHYNKHCHSNYTTTNIYHRQQQMPNLNPCSTLLSPPPTSNLLPHAMLKHGYMSTLDSFLLPNRHHHHQPAVEPTQDIYHQYYQTFHHIQRAT